jgi:hypothetical protein
MKQQTIFDMTYREILSILWFRFKEDATGYFEQLLFNQQWYRKKKGGKWNLLCHNKDIFWSPESRFVETMAEFGAIVDVLKTDDWG